MNELQKIADIEAQIEAFLKKYDCDDGLDELEISPTPSKRLKKVSCRPLFWLGFISSSHLRCFYAALKSAKAADTVVKAGESRLNDLELVICIYRLLSYDFFYYSKKWNYSSLVRIMNEHGTCESSEVIGQANRPFFKWMIVKILTKLLMMTANQQHHVFGLYFSQADQKKLEIM